METNKNKVCMSKKEFVAEHVGLVRKLKNAKKAELDEEAKEQGAELKKVQKS